MISDLLAQLPRSQREAVESAGYRISRWSAARTILQTRITKARITGALGDFLTHWLSQVPAYQPFDELSLSFHHTSDQLPLKLAGGSTSLVTSPLEHALLHLPALRFFWNQELRQHHFQALRALVPQTWLLDTATVPPGAVIQGLGATSWEQIRLRGGQNWEIQDLKGLLREDWHGALAARDSILISRAISSVTIKARYGRNDKGQVVLRSTEAAP